MGRRRKLDGVHRVDATRLRIDNLQGVPITLFANDDIPVDAGAVEELLEFVSLQETLDSLSGIASFWNGEPGRLASVVVTPDFHRGSGIPIGTVTDARGFVIPRVVGNDVCCGMRLIVTDLTRSEVEPLLDRLAGPLRASFFEGRRNIPMSPRQREALLRCQRAGSSRSRTTSAGRAWWTVATAISGRSVAATTSLRSRSWRTCSTAARRTRGV